MIAGRSFTVHLGIVIEEIRVDLVEYPGLLHDELLHKDEERGRDPIDEGASWPLMSEGQVQELEHLEEGTETVHKPMLIFLCNTSL